MRTRDVTLWCGRTVAWAAELTNGASVMHKSFCKDYSLIVKRYLSTKTQKGLFKV